MTKRIRSIWLLGVLLFPGSAVAGSLHLNTTLVGQVRENERDQREIPANGYLGFGWVGSKNITLRSQMRLFRDLDRRLDDYDLYQAVLHFEPAGSLRVDFGRQFVNQGFSVEMLDGIQTTLLPPGPIEVAVFSGIPRSVERGDFNENDGLLTGLSAGLKGVSGTNARIRLAWRKNDIKVSDLRQNDEVRIGTNLSHQWAIEGRPMLYGLAEYDATSKVVDAGTVGVELAPASWVVLNLEGNYFDVNRESSRPTILALFAAGQVWTGRVSSTWTLVPGLLDLTESYSYQRYEIQDGVRRNGYLLDAGLPLSFEAVGLFVQPGYYFAKSFGGDVHGVRAGLHEDFTDKLSADAGVDFATYDKITSDDDNAFSTVVWTGYEILKGWKVSAGFEYNRNNLFDRDVRGSLKVDYRYDRSL